jgi:hypothetical protein
MRNAAPESCCVLLLLFMMMLLLLCEESAVWLELHTLFYNGLTANTSVAAGSASAE